MRRTRRTVRSLPKDDDTSGEDEPLRKKTNIVPSKRGKNAEDYSSSDSDIETYLQPMNKIDLSSSFFNPQHEDTPLEKMENADVSRLSSSDSDDDKLLKSLDTQTTKFNFQQLHEYTKKLEETKLKVDEYNARTRVQNNDLAIFDMLKSKELKDEERPRVSLEDLHSSDFESCSDSEKEGWQEVKSQKLAEPSTSATGKNGIEITVEMPGVIRKKKKGTDLVAAMIRRLNRLRKEHQVSIHKVHLLCWIAHGNYVNSVINRDNLLSLSLSLLPNDKCYPPKRTDLKYLEQILKWYRKTIDLVEEPSLIDHLETCLGKQIEKKQVNSKKMLVYIFISVLRALGIHCRLVLSLQVEPLRPPAGQLCSLSTKKDGKTDNAEKTKVTKEKNGKNVKNEVKSTDRIKIALPKSEKKPAKTSIEEKMDGKGKNGVDTKRVSKNAGKTGEKLKTQEKLMRVTRNERKTDISAISKKEPEEKVKKAKNEGKIEKKAKNEGETSKRMTRSESKSTTSSRGRSIPQVDGGNDDIPSTSRRTRSKPNLKKLQEPVRKIGPKRLKSAPTKYKDTDSEEEFVATPTRSQFKEKNFDSLNNSGRSVKLASPVVKQKQTARVDVKNDIVKIMKSRIREEKHKESTRIVKNKRKMTDNSSSDSDYAPEPVEKKPHSTSDDEFVPKTKVKRRINPKVISSDEDRARNSPKKKAGNDVWAEVFLESEEKWISVDVINGRIHCVNEIFKKASSPVSYILAWNNDNSIKDITARYCQNFNTITRKLRVDSKWWKESLSPFLGTKTARDREEDDELERQQLEKPLPTSIAEFKNHPLYVLKRHLLKFESIYPPDAPTLGFVRKEAVYSRQCVYTLHSREIWLKHAKTVKLGEEPYKIVKARPKWDKLSNSVITDQLLEVFGPWQTEDYVPPTAENGIVPRNAFGNVELFKMCMLPKKTVHLQLPGLNKVAKKLNIDCASAIVGFDFHGGYSHPTYDGFVVCEEFRDVLQEAWEKEQEEMEKKENEKIDKRVYGNWKKLIRGLLIRERLKAKYDFGGPSTATGGGNKKKTKTVKISTKRRRKPLDNESDSN